MADRAQEDTPAAGGGAVSKTHMKTRPAMSSRKAPNAAVKAKADKSVNQKIADFLFELANYERNVSRDMNRYNAYRKAASAIASHPAEIQSGDQALKLNGVGKKIAKKIDEFLATGKLEKLEKIRADDGNRAINTLTQVANIGPAKAKELVDQGITTLDDLRRHQDKLNKAQRIGLKHFDDFEKRIPRSEIQEVEKRIRKTLNFLDTKYLATVCGSYRRGLPSSGDVDVLITHPNYTSEKSAKECGVLLHSAVEALETDKLITDTISHGDTKFSGVFRLDAQSRHRRLDLRLLPSDQYFCGVLYFTGSDMFNKQMRAHALEQNFTLNEYTLRPLDQGHQPGKPLPVSSEEDIFDYISYEYRGPEERNL